MQTIRSPKLDRVALEAEQKHRRRSSNIDKKGEDSRDVTKRYNLILPADLFEEIQKVAEDNQTTVADLIRRFIKLGLLAMYLQDEPDAALIIREGDSEKQVLLL